MSTVGAIDVELRQVSRYYGPVKAVDQVDLQIERGEFVALLGPSGSGKTTTLRIVAGLVEPTAGDVFIKGRRVNDVPVHKRDLAMVFQNYALFPHLTVGENVAFGLKMRCVPRAETARRVREALRLIQLEGYERRYPNQLSGGQQQRVALARCIAVEPAVLLLDEPLGALDRKLREAMQVELRQLQRQLGITTIFVTHDQEEALTMSDRIAVMNLGRIEQLGTPLEIYEHPRTRFVSQFIGTSNFLQGTFEDGRFPVVRTRRGLTIRLPAGVERPGAREVTVSLRPEKIILTPMQLSSPPSNSFPVTVDNVIYLGTNNQYYVHTEGGENLLVFQQNLAGGATHLAPGDQAWVSWEPEANQLLAG